MPKQSQATPTAAVIAEPTVDVMGHLATLFHAKALHWRAEPYYRRALAIAEANFQPSDPRIATRLNNLAQLLQATNRLGEAEPLMRRVISIFEASHGSDHPDVAIDYNNLAALLQATNRLGEAEPLMRRALTIDEASYGPDHPLVARGLNNLAQLLQATNRLGEAEPLIRRALAIDEVSYGPDHPDVATGLSNLARLMQATNRLGEAEPLSRRVVAILLAFQRDTGHAHPHRDTAIASYAALLAAMGNTEADINATLRVKPAPFVPAATRRHGRRLSERLPLAEGRYRRSGATIVPPPAVAGTRPTADELLPGILPFPHSEREIAWRSSPARKNNQVETGTGLSVTLPSEDQNACNSRAASHHHPRHRDRRVRRICTTGRATAGVMVRHAARDLPLPSKQRIQLRSAASQRPYGLALFPLPDLRGCRRTRRLLQHDKPKRRSSDDRPDYRVAVGRPDQRNGMQLRIHRGEVLTV
jgi:tetratricopeptide (TPR) repeat protein